MLAYSSIAQAGYILIAIITASVAVQSTSASLDIASYGLAGGVFHVFTHASMKGVAFLVVAAASVLFIGEDLEGWRGLGKRSPFLAFAMAAFLFSLAGIPPFGGFFSKFVLFSYAVFCLEKKQGYVGKRWVLWV